MTPPEYAQLKAECLGLRAFIHFDLLRLFGWGNLKERPDMLNRLCIPYAFQYTKEIVPQVTVGTALEYMEKDLTEAEKLILPLIIMLCWQLGCVLPCGKVIILLPENMRKIY